MFILLTFTRANNLNYYRVELELRPSREPPRF